MHALVETIQPIGVREDMRRFGGTYSRCNIEAGLTHVHSVSVDKCGASPRHHDAGGHTQALGCLFSNEDLPTPSLTGGTHPRICWNHQGPRTEWGRHHILR